MSTLGHLLSPWHPTTAVWSTTWNMSYTVHNECLMHTPICTGTRATAAKRYRCVCMCGVCVFIEYIVHGTKNGLL